MYLLHEDVGGDDVEVDVLEEGAQDLVQVAVGGVAVLLAPHESGLARAEQEINATCGKRSGVNLIEAFFSRVGKTLRLYDSVRL